MLDFAEGMVYQRISASGPILRKHAKIWASTQRYR